MAAIFFGILFPFQRSGTQFPAAASDDALIRGDLIQLVSTQKGERPMRPDWGTSTWSLVFEGSEALFDELLRADLQDAIGKYEPRVILQEITIERLETEVRVAIYYVVRSTGNPDSVGLSLSNGGA